MPDAPKPAATAGKPASEAASSPAGPVPTPPGHPAGDKPGAEKAAGDKSVAAAAAPEGADKPMAPAVLKARIASLAKGADGAGVGAPRIDVRKTDEGLLISLTDSADFSMFPSASARPAGKMVVLVEKIGQLLKTQKGTVTVRGFTDSRPFRSDTYDNWRLSTARAQIAHYMLVQGGLADDRIDRIEGYADRHPKNPRDPLSPENRRIEILLRDTTP
jgi:chemotaxis protein MotB